MEDSRRLQEQKEEEHGKKKILKDTITLKRILEEEESFVERGKKLNEDFEVAQRILTDSTACLQKAIVERDGVGIKVASEMIATSPRKLKEANKMKGYHNPKQI